MKPFEKRHRLPSGFLHLAVPVLMLSLVLSSKPLWAADGATEALQVRLQAEWAILDEERTGDRELALAMRETLPDLLLEYLVTRDGSVALDTLDAVFVREEMEAAKLSAEPGVALALDVFSGPGTGYEHNVRSAIANLAGYHEDQAARAKEAALHVYERQIEHNVQAAERKLQEIERHLERPQAELLHLEAKLELKDERLGIKRLAETHRLEEKLEKVQEKAEKVAEKVEQRAEKVQEKIEKVAEKVEQRAEKVQEKIEKVAEKVEEKEDKSDSDSDSSGKKNKNKDD